MALSSRPPIHYEGLGTRFILEAAEVGDRPQMPSMTDSRRSPTFLTMRDQSIVGGSPPARSADRSSKRRLLHGVSLEQNSSSRIKNRPCPDAIGEGRPPRD